MSAGSTATSNRPKRSDSSAAIRQHLKSNLGTVPEISPTISLLSYMKYCKTLYESAIRAYQQRDMRRSYVDLYKFQILALQKIPTHKDYKTKSPATETAKKWLDKTKLPALNLLEEVVYCMDQEEDARIRHEKELSLIDEFEDEPSPPPAPAAAPATPPDAPSIRAAAEARAEALQRKFSDLSVLSVQPSPVEIAPSEQPIQLQYTVPEFDYSEQQDEQQEDCSDAALAASIARTEANILRCIGDYRRFTIPQPSTTTIDVQVGARHHFFLQDDFHTSFAGFLTALSPELQLSYSATEMNRCFFIHLGIAMGVHPFALQTGFRALATAALETAEEWEKDILSTVKQYCGFVDANMLCFLWPDELRRFRICFISGPLSKPLISCFQPPVSVTGGNAEQLTEILIRCSGDHFTLLRPMPQQQHPQNGEYRVISRLLQEARVAKLVVQVSDARERPPGAPPLSIEGALSRLRQL